MDVDHTRGENKAFLHDRSCCAFPEEKEYLLGWGLWKVTKITEETLEYKGKKLEAIVIFVLSIVFCLVFTILKSIQ